jgi:2,4-diaminopentanoate dehydrogenase
MPPMLRVVHTGTGVSGIEGLRQVLAHPELELVGIRATSPEKVGQDAGVLAGSGPCGITATDDLDSLLALNADCISYCAKGNGREMEAATEIASFLERGTNAVTHSLISMTYPARAPRAIRDLLSDACDRGGSTFYNTGIEPGVMSGQLLVTALSFAGRVDSVEIIEFADMRNYAVPEVARHGMGLGMPADYISPRYENNGAGVQAFWRQDVDFAADLVGIALDDYEFRYTTVTTPEALHSTFGVIAPGTIGATMWEIVGTSEGQPRVMLRHYTAVRPCAGADWPPLPCGAEHTAYQVKVRGSSTYEITAVVDPDPETGHDPAIAAIAIHAINAIPTVCAAAPGVLDQRSVRGYTTRVVG